MNIIKEMAIRAYNDKYLYELLYKLQQKFINQFFLKENIIALTEQDINHLLRFADILCRSEESLHRNLSLKIISLFLEIEEVKNMDYFRIIAANTLISLGNFPSLPLIDDKEKYLNIFEIKYNYIIKKIIQNSCLDKPFTDAQYNVFEEIKKSDYYSFSGSTSFGKSFIFEAYTKYIIEEHNQKHNIAFIVPTKALINQVGTKLKTLVANYNYKVITSPIIPKVFLNKGYKFILVFTPERLIAYLTEKYNPKIDYLFVDEAHKLLDKKDTRTPLLYHALVFAKRKSVNIYFASPNIPNAEIFLSLINNETTETTESMSIIESPVTQNKFFIDTINNNSFMISDYGEDIKLSNLKFEKGDPIRNLQKILNIFSKDTQSIIYCNTKDKTLKTAIEFSEKLTDVDKIEINEIIKLIDDKVHNQYYLKKCLKKGIAYHFGGIPEEIKLQIENLYKKGIIQYLFCTSTLLEGVNFPTKNIFILSEKISKNNMTDIDFWNLAGRADRLAKDLSGNIFCVNIFNQQGYWKDMKNIEMFRKKTIKPIKPLLLSKQNEHLYENICNYFDEKNYTNKSLSFDKKKTIEMYGNILLYHTLIENNSVLVNNFNNKIENSNLKLQDIKNKLKVPSNILATSIGINIVSQNRILSNTMEPLPEKTTLDDCKNVLDILYDQYKWNETESGSKKSMLKDKKQLNYYAVLMKEWIDSKPLKFIIQKTIDYYDNKGNARYIYLNNEDYKNELVEFNKENDLHINTLINNLINDIETNLRFIIKNYVSNYQALLMYQNNLNQPTVDWESFIEYGTTNSEIIEIQNLGFSRNIAIFLKNNYAESLLKNEQGILYDIDEQYLYNNIDKVKFKTEYEELTLFFNWDSEEENEK